MPRTYKLIWSWQLLHSL